MSFDKPLSEAELAGYRALIKRRLAGESRAYLLGEQEFWGLPFHVDASVLVPRPDTETVIEVARATRTDRAARVSRARPVHRLGSDRDRARARSCRRRAWSRPTSPRRPWRSRARTRSATASPIASRSARETCSHRSAGERFDLITANPPYIATAVISTLSAEVRREPRARARWRRRRPRVLRPDLRPGARDYLESGGALVVEHGFDQADAVRGRLAAAGFTGITLVHDLGKNPRVTWAVRP